MILMDVNILVYAHRKDSPHHQACYQFLEEVLGCNQAFAIASLVLSGFLRVVTHPKIFSPPSTMKQAMSFVRQIANSSNCVIIQPGNRHWEIFEKLCSQEEVKGNLVSDAYFAALAIEAGCEWVSMDQDYKKFKELRFRNLLDVSIY